MKKVILITLTIITIFSLISCDYRRQISKEKCNEIYNHIRDNFIFNNVDDYLYYDYSCDLLIISYGEQLYSNKEPGFFLNYDYNKYIIDMQVIINNYVPLDIIGYRINSQVEFPGRGLLNQRSWILSWFLVQKYVYFTFQKKFT